MGVNILEQGVLQGRFDFFRSISVHSPLEWGFEEKRQNIFYISGFDFATCNGILERQIDRIPTEEEIDQAIQFFQKKQIPFIWWSSAKVLETKGFQFGGILTGIASDFSQGLPEKPNLLPQLELVRVKNEEELAIFSKIVVEEFGMKSQLLNYFHALNRSSMNQNEQVHFLAKWENVPVGTMTLSTHAQSAGLWNMATRPEYRKRGIGTALVYAALEEAQKLGYKQAMAILMPKGLAWCVFKKLGFQEACTFPFYIYGASAEEIEK